MRRACRWTPRRSRGYFNPRIPYGMRHPTTGEQYPPLAYFNPRIPYGMRRRANDTFARDLQFQSTHPVWDATLIHAVDQTHVIISIHASRMGCDGSGRATKQRMWLISIHASRMGCDVYDSSGVLRKSLFQSTHPVWDATNLMFDLQTLMLISIHASRMGCDSMLARRNSARSHFNPRIPYGMRQHLTNKKRS